MRIREVVTMNEPSEASAYGNEGTGMGLLLGMFMLLAVHYSYIDAYAAATSLGALGLFFLWAGSEEATEAADRYVEKFQNQTQWTDDAPVLTLWNGKEVSIVLSESDGKEWDLVDRFKGETFEYGRYSAPDHPCKVDLVITEQLPEVEDDG